jgi:hypothetical protein
LALKREVDQYSLLFSNNRSTTVHHSTEILSLILSVKRFSASFLREANFLIMIVGLTVNTSFVPTSLGFFSSLSRSAGLTGNENLSHRITDVILATM